MRANPYAQYQSIDLEAKVESASPHGLIAMLYEGLLTRVAQAKHAMLAGQFEQKGLNVTKAINILGGLKDGLDAEQSPELAERLEELYDYCQRRLLDASAQRDTDGFDEVSALIREVKEAWDAIQPEVARMAVAS
ncbi:flagellar export chaperone FliS [Guyparkeria halophila]|uniref:Flagellar secretion chaperone FliS n=1 Tax=Guyparkeria halophila TaxID=47960 RepID=A0ABZ0Z140_9GAMM|nr:flagellar export chaperone FliS [Guyparkeria halophila]WQH17137.1 flagellar export chaperone FliS [Guyparkeria halophila]